MDCRDFLGVLGGTGSFSGVMYLCFGFLASVENSPSSYFIDFFLFLSDLRAGDLSVSNETVFFSLACPIFQKTVEQEQFTIKHRITGYSNPLNTAKHSIKIE